jgi:hypothetical protein
MLCLMPRQRVLALLEPHAGSSSPGLQRLLAFLGHPKGMEAYVQQVEQVLSEATLSDELFGGIGTKHLMPDQGYAPASALMLGSLCLNRDKRAIPLLSKLAARIAVEPKDLRPGWGYYFTLACGFERLASEEGRQPLKQVLASPVFKDQIVSRNGDIRSCKNTVAERMAYLRMALSRALLRCGDAEGALGLCEFLNEARVCLARAARSELVAATGQNFGFQPTVWREWILKNGASLKPNPLTQTFA